MYSNHVLEPRVMRDITVHTNEQSVQRLCMRKCDARKVCLSTLAVFAVYLSESSFSSSMSCLLKTWSVALESELIARVTETHPQTQFLALTNEGRNLWQRKRPLISKPWQRKDSKITECNMQTTFTSILLRSLSPHKNISFYETGPTSGSSTEWYVELPSAPPQT